ncbi:hypothetical protein D2V17_04840 [Aurantiacibacter xanthus]|uniref:Uncharacterized protein n=1 Tax=Aurantiacibacter xanthus TaxID=1784712 RepID=A0A3A1P9A4_9SPHN|nr:hypothetical protein [Aurantiacibacter xanthus]RIV90101.1 hypothetical protein D2V17_04840 [Aurantiacibacter xanthus]
MFEPKHPFAPDNTGHASESEVQDGLHPVSWGELNARLTAARELRIAFGEEGAGDVASFDAEFARHVAHLHEPAEPDGNNRINHDHSTYGKRADGNTAGRHEDWRPATRGKE